MLHDYPKPLLGIRFLAYALRRPGVLLVLIAAQINAANAIYRRLADWFEKLERIGEMPEVLANLK